MKPNRESLTLLLDPELIEEIGVMAKRIHKGATGARSEFLRNVILLGTRMCDAVWTEDEAILQVVIESFRNYVTPVVRTREEVVG